MTPEFACRRNRILGAATLALSLLTFGQVTSWAQSSDPQLKHLERLNSDCWPLDLSSAETTDQLSLSTDQQQPSDQQLPSDQQQPSEAPQPIPENTFNVFGFVMLDSGYNVEQIDPNWFDVMRPTKLPAFANEFAPSGTDFFGVRQTDSE